MDIFAQILVNALIAGSIYALASSGLSLVYGVMRVLNFAHGHLMMTGVYFYFFAKVQMGWGIAGSILFTIASMTLLSTVVFRVFVSPFSRLSFLLTLVTTLALSNMLEALVSIFFGVDVKSLSTGIAGQSLQLGSIYITPIQILIIASAIFLLFLFAFIIHSTAVGRKIRAVSESPHAAESISISSQKVSCCVFLLGTLLAAYAGILVGYETNMQPTMGTIYTIKSLAAMIFGGLGNIWGAIFGSYLLGLIENLSLGLDFWGFSLPAGYKDAFSFVIILLVLLFRSQGLFGAKLRTA